MRGLLTLVTRFSRDRRAAVSIVAAFTMVASLCAAGIVTDTAIIYLHKRKAQAAVDIAAMMAARDLDAATDLANATLADNGFPAPAVATVTVGQYDADPDLAVASRFTAGGSPGNAVKVTLSDEAPVVLWSAFFGGEKPEVTAEAVAMRTGLANLSIGTRLASLEGGVANGVLSDLLGASIDLDVMDYEALLDADVDMIDLLDQLAVNAGFAGETYSDLAELTVGPADIGTALEDLLEENGAAQLAIDAVNNIANAASGGTIQVSDLIDVGPLGSNPVGGDAGMDVTTSAFDILFATARLADGIHAAEVEFDLTVAGTGLTVHAAIGEAPVSTGWVAVGEAGATVHSAQMRIYIKAEVLGTGALLGGHLLTIPIYLEVAAGVATITSIQCGWNDTDVEVGVEATPGVAEVWLAAVDEANLPSFGTDITPAEATLVNTGLIKVLAYSNAAVTDPDPNYLTFDYDEIQAGVLKTVGTDTFLGSALGSILGTTNVTVDVIGLGIPLGLGAVKGIVAQILSQLLNPADAVLANTLRALGVGVGEMDVRVGGVRCDAGALVL